ncbi:MULTISPECIES: hypothetical protein [Paraburkholderia]|uniref:Uncharacterized protein n=1 Tax=Paraburkholderia podalyriae TaxID=1938811 RepID=A0ABR7Q2I6_9BURK|nr:hypothetical protein [Paraburkholderia podalyriae]MBC8752707.1 hypothetical protein [Paraburkholderia podalyriae]
MITLNGEKELTRIHDWADILARPGFDGQLDPNAHELEAIIGSYALRDRIPCGLSNCRTPHGRGYLVATKDGRTTNIGKDCGRLYFGVDFETMLSQFTRDIAAKEHRERLWSFSFRLDEINAAVASLRKGDAGAPGADWVHKKSRALLVLNSGCPAPIVRRVVQLLRTGGDEVMGVREATREEIAREEAMSGRTVKRPHYVEAVVGRVGHLHALRSENDLREILIVDLETNLKAFADLDIDNLSPSQLSYWSKWSGGVELSLERAGESIRMARALLTPENLAPLATLVSEPAEVAQFKTYLAGLGAP